MVQGLEFLSHSVAAGYCGSDHEAGWEADDRACCTPGYGKPAAPKL